MVFKRLKRCCNSMKNGRTSAPKTVNKRKAIGKIGMMYSVSCQLVRNKMIKVVTNRINDCAVRTNPWARKIRNRSTSSVARIMICPVWVRS